MRCWRWWGSLRRCSQARARLRVSDPLARTVAAAALAGFGYWLVHGSIDWFWEFAGLGAPAFALLGLACALAPSPAAAAAGCPAPGGAPAARRCLRRCAAALALGACALLALLAAWSLAAPWLSELQVQSAARVWTNAPRRPTRGCATPRS